MVTTSCVYLILIPHYLLLIFALEYQNDASNPIYSRDDTAEDTEVDMMAVGRVVHENRERHVRFGNIFIN